MPGMRASLKLSLAFFGATCTILLGINVFVVSGQCLDDQKYLLLQLEKENHEVLQWNQSIDCCKWKGVSCEQGRVTGLALSNVGVFFNLSSLFKLQHLKSLDLSNTSFHFTFLPRIFDLTNLVHLNLSSAAIFEELIPLEISRLTQLVTLDLSNISGSSIKNFSNLFRNLTQLQELYLDGANISWPGTEWCQALSSSLPNLRVLSLRGCGLSSPIDHSLLKLQSLSVIQLDYNNFSSVPIFLSNFSKLKSLCFIDCGLSGIFPKEILQMPKLQSLYISHNPHLQVSFPKFPQNCALRNLELSNTRVLGSLLPTSLSMCKNLTTISLSNVGLRDQLSSVQWQKLSNLAMVDMGSNCLKGNIPSSFFAIPSMQLIRLSDNLLSGHLPEFPNASFSKLHTLDLACNNLEGPIPMSMFQQRKLRFLSLASNEFNGKWIFTQELENLSYLDLSHSNLSVDASGLDTYGPAFTKISVFLLSSCNLRKFPSLKYVTNLIALDLSNNQIHGKIPSWFWSTLGNNQLEYLNISHNYLWDHLPTYFPLHVDILDLSFNQLQGQIPAISPASFGFLDFSRNNFSLSIPVDIGYMLHSVVFLSLSSNSLTGVIPESICRAPYLVHLDLSNNSLSGSIPAACMTSMNGHLKILDLHENKLSGPIPDTFPKDNCILESLHLNGNLITGQLPQSLAYCSELELLDVGNNQMVGNFPCFLKRIPTLRVLVLRFNNFYGTIGCPNANGILSPLLQIVDLAHNNFSGKLQGGFFRNWPVMMDDRNLTHSNMPSHVQYWVDIFGGLYYQDEVRVTIKGLELELVKILTEYTSIDLSCNNFHGPIPFELGKLQELYFLNLSHNALNGPIPFSLGKYMHRLESLDLSRNHLSGIIPAEVESLNFLSFLNLSYNQLEGRIPLSTQLQSFSSSSFIGNKGLCGPPLILNCHTFVNTSPTNVTPQIVLGAQMDWSIIATVIGFIFGFGIVNGPLIFCNRWRRWYFERVEDIAYWFIPLVVLRKWWSWKARFQIRRWGR